MLLGGAESLQPVRGVSRWLLRLEEWAIPWLDRAGDYRWLRPMAGAAMGWILARNIRVILRHGQVRHLEHVENTLRQKPGLAEFADEMRDVLGDKTEFVLKRDSDAWRAADGE